MDPWLHGVYRDEYYWHRLTGACEVDTSGHHEWERQHVTGCKWWSVSELRKADELIVPLGLADVVEQITSGLAPAAAHVFARSAPDST